MTTNAAKQVSIEHSANGVWVGRFQAMASPCEILIDCDAFTASEVASLVNLGAEEAWRIEAKFSRYREGNSVYQINNARGGAVTVDDEMADLLDYATQCYELSDGLFDISTGPLRRVWQFTGDRAVLDQKALQEALESIGWARVNWSRPILQMPAGAEIDFGGIGKEYAVDRTLRLLLEQATQGTATPGVSVLVNFGGDLACSNARQTGEPWRVGIEALSAQSPLQLQAPAKSLKLSQGALATSGDTHRFVYYQGQRLSHVLNPKTGYPVKDAPQSVTVAAPNCTLAGMLATFAMLQGAEAEAFLEAQGVAFWIQRWPEQPR